MVGLIEEHRARNGDRIALVRVPHTTSHLFGDDPAHYIVTINGGEVFRPRTKVQGHDKVIRLLAARAHGY